MNVTFACPRCEKGSTVELAAEAASVECPACHALLDSPAEAWGDHELKRCLICGSGDLFIRKDFPHRLGLLIVVAGFAASCVTWYFYWTYLTFAVLFATAAADMALYFIVGESLVCYRCRAEYRQLAAMNEHAPFNLETHERYRQQAARLATSRAPARAGQEVPSGGESPGR